MRDITLYCVYYYGKPHSSQVWLTIQSREATRELSIHRREGRGFRCGLMIRKLVSLDHLKSSLVNPYHRPCVMSKLCLENLHRSCGINPKSIYAIDQYLIYIHKSSFDFVNVSKFICIIQRAVFQEHSNYVFLIKFAFTKTFCRCKLRSKIASRETNCSCQLNIQCLFCSIVAQC